MRSYELSSPDLFFAYEQKRDVAKWIVPFADTIIASRGCSFAFKHVQGTDITVNNDYLKPKATSERTVKTSFIFPFPPCYLLLL